MASLDIFPGYESVEAYCKDVLRATFSCAKASNSFDPNLFEYYNTFKGFREAITKERDTVSSLISGLITGQKVGDGFMQLDEDEQLDFLKEVNASVLENVSYLLEETDGEKKPDVEIVVARKPYAAINTSWNKKLSTNNKTLDKLLLGAKNIVRPQFAFKDKVDNSNSIFVPVIKEKPNSIRPFAIFLEKDEEGEEEFCHPYECEIEKFQPSPDQFVICDPKQPPTMEKTSLIYVNTPEQLKLLCKELKDLKEFAVDVEHHSYRTFQGISCLLQVSTREKDYLVDGIALRSELWILNEVFTDPKIVKVLHGADMDILWLQRDFGLYIVNMFDTGQAARVLNFAHLSLAYLMKHYCNIELDKQYQLADWRMRPLPEELQNYARGDTHHLLYIFDCMKNELLKKGNTFHNLLHSVFDRSKAVCLKKYKKMVFNDEKYLEMYRKSRKHFNTRQLFCLKELYAWRNNVARVEDESYGYVLPNHMLLQICEVLPRDHQGILACCNPVPPLVQQQLNEIYATVSKANDSPLTQLSDSQSAVQPADNFSSLDLNNMLHCPHDIHSYDDNRMHLHNSSETSSKEDGDKELNAPIKTKPVLSFEIDLPIQDKNDASKQIAENISKQNKTIYDRYLLTIKYRAALDPDKEENLTIETEDESKQFITIQDGATSQSNTVTTPEQEVITIDDDNDDELTATNQETPILLKTLLTKKKKKRRNQEKRNFDTSFGSTSTQDDMPSKKSKTPEQQSYNADNFLPFDYKNARTNSAKGKPNSAQLPQEDRSPRNSNPNSRRWHQKKSGRQASYSVGANRTNSNGRNWPKM